MYVKIGPVGPDADFSWIIAKNPASPPYVRKVGGATTGRSVEGHFDDGGAYDVVVKNDGLLFFNQMRAANEAAYVRAEPWIVCPANLKGFAIVFKSALQGEVGKDVTTERYNAPRHMRAEIGPFPATPWVEFFQALGLKVETLEEGMTEAHTIILTTIEPMSVTIFLQKVYISMMVFTAKWAFYEKVEDAQVEKYLALTKGWLGDVTDERVRNLIVSRLTNYRKSLQARFAAADPEDAEVHDADVPGDAKEAELEGRRPGVAMSLHDRRHELILSNMVKAPIPGTEEAIVSMPTTIVDLGSGEGKLIRKLLERNPTSRVLGVDARRDRINRTKRGLRELNQRAQIFHDNLLFPRNWEDLVGADVLVASEVIEHLGRSDRGHFIRLIAELLEPKMLFITTPNIEANVPVLGMTPGEFRHDDHRIEYTHAEFAAEVVRPLSVFYEVTYLEVSPGEAIQPSFCIMAKRKEDVRSPNSGVMGQVIRRYSEPSYFPTTDVTVTTKDMREGFTSHPFLDNAANIFYLGPAIAPVDYISDLDQYLAGSSEGGPYLEHPLAAFNYYKERGETTLIEEKKYMGSRGYALIFKDAEQARGFGYKYPIIMNARSGGRFFKDPTRMMPIWEDIAPKMKDDYTILDMEVMPWALKAEKLISDEFILPGEAALLWRKRNEPLLADNAAQFLRMARSYGENTPLEVRAFHILASGNLKESTKHNNWMLFRDTRYGFYRSHTDQLREIATLAGDIVKPAEYDIVDLGSTGSMARSVARWRAYCESGGEGFVYKPYKFMTVGESGYPLQPALKVRGKDYLRIIYGMDYLHPEYFDRLKARGTKMKRLLAVQEQDIAIQILRCFVNGNAVERTRAIGAFLGLEWAQTSLIDKTL